MKQDDKHEKTDKNDKHEKKKHAEGGVMDHSDEIKRLNRVIGQIEGVQKMLEGHRKLEDILMQCKAIHSALHSVESRVLKTHVEALLEEIESLDKKKSRAEKVAELEKLFKHAS